MDTTKLSQSPAPHHFAKNTSSWIMLQVIIALLFPTAAAIYYFGVRALVNVLLAVVCCISFEYLYQRIRKIRVTTGDFSAAVTGHLLGLSLASSVPLWAVIVGSAFAMFIKHWGGGIGKNVFNPAVAARVMLKIFFTPWITNWVLPGPDAVSTSTPLTFINHFARNVPPSVNGLWDLFLGRDLGGNVGETSSLMIVIGMAYLIVRKIIEPKIPFLYVSTVALITFLYSGFDIEFMLTHVLTGTLLFGATFMATDYSSGALTPQGKTAFAIGCGILTALIRILFDFPGGVGFAILIMNGFAPFIDKKLAPRIYGHEERPKL